MLGGVGGFKTGSSLKERPGERGGCAEWAPLTFASRQRGPGVGRAAHRGDKGAICIGTKTPETGGHESGPFVPGLAAVGRGWGGAGRLSCLQDLLAALSPGVIHHPGRRRAPTEPETAPQI